MNDKLKIEEIKNVFGEKSFTSDDLYHFYQKYDPNLKKNTFRWRVYALKKETVRTRNQLGGNSKKNTVF